MIVLALLACIWRLRGGLHNYNGLPASTFTDDHLTDGRAFANDLLDWVPAKSRRNALSSIQMLDPSKSNIYNVCHFKRVCTFHHETEFFTFDETLTSQLRQQYECCFNSSLTSCGKETRSFCLCFTNESRAVFRTLPRKSHAVSFELQPAFQISQYLKKKKHHFAHFAFSVVQMHSILRHTAALKIPKIETVIFQDGAGTGQLNAVEASLWGVISNGKGGAPKLEVNDFRFMRVRRNDSNQMFGYPRYCFESVHTAVGRDVYAMTAEDMDGFKQAARSSLGVQYSTTGCPPRRAAIVVRRRGMGLRRILNMDQVVHLMRQKGIQTIETLSPSEDESLDNQALQFSRVGLIVSSHSSQLANLLFAHPNAVVLETSPVFKDAFRHLGNVSRLKYINSVGHTPTCEGHPELERLFVQLRAGGCRFDRMVLERGYDCGMSEQQRVALSRCDYTVDIASFEKQLMDALLHLENVCKPVGGWISTPMAALSALRISSRFGRLFIRASMLMTLTALVLLLKSGTKLRKMSTEGQNDISRREPIALLGRHQNKAANIPSTTSRNDSDERSHIFKAEQTHSESVLDAALKILRKEEVGPSQSASKSTHPSPQSQPTLHINVTSDIHQSRVNENANQHHVNKHVLLQVLPHPDLDASLFPRTEPTFSRIEMFDANRPDSINPYKVCHMQNVCVQDGYTIFFTNNDAQTKALTAQYQDCCSNPPLPDCKLSKEQRSFCGCFSPESRLVIETRGKSSESFETQPAWMISQWLQTKKHHIAHFSYSVIQLHNIYLHKEALNLPRIETVVFQDGAEAFNQFESDMWDIVSEGAGFDHIADFRFLRGRRDIHGGKKRECFASVHSTIRGDLYAVDFKDMSQFKKVASKLLRIPLGLEEDRPGPACPPRKAAIVTRKSGVGLRRITNLNDTIRLLHKKGISEIDVISPSEQDTLYEQAVQFSGYGLLVSSHSSQLTNLVFAHNNSVVIEVSPVYKHAFAHLGRVSGTKYLNSVGHAPEGVPETVKELFQRLKKDCDFGRMIREPLFRCGLSREDHVMLSRTDFRLDLEAFERAVDEGLEHLESVCSSVEGGWTTRRKLQQE
ncbi:hypothetical protein HDU77_001428 [Chytriomyces hyalinus]|nr:hypothetical protein HDU77_001428 [Chytriomyces hyalinus]